MNASAQLRLRHILRPREVTGKPGLPVLSVYRDHGVILKESRDDNSNKTPDDLARYQEVRPGDLVVNKMKAWQGSVAVSRHLGIVSPDYLVCEVKGGVYRPYLHYLLRSSALVWEYGRRSKGIRPAQWRLYWDDLANISVTLPPPEEQRRISAFLDSQTAHIDSVVSARHRQRKLLKDRVDQLVDGVTIGEELALTELGLPIKMGEWQTSKISHLCRVIPGFAFPSTQYVNPHKSTRLLRGVNVGVDSIDWNESVGWDQAAHPVSPVFRLRVGDLVMGMDRPWIKGGTRVAFVERKDLPALLLQRVACLRPRGEVDMGYIRLVLSSSHFRYAVESELTGVSVPHLSTDQIGGFQFHFPPVDIQRSISQAIAGQKRNLVELNALIDQQIATLTERRQASITAAVTEAKST